jgi:hypothetical protein
MEGQHEVEVSQGRKVSDFAVFVLYFSSKLMILKKLNVQKQFLHRER